MTNAYRALYVAWQGHDSWNGPEDVDGTMHLSLEDYQAYLDKFMATQPVATPDYYIRPSESPRWIDIPAALYNQLSKARGRGQLGLRVSATTKTTFRART